MIDPRILRDDPDRVRAAQAKRGLSDEVVDRALAVDGASTEAFLAKTLILDCPSVIWRKPSHGMGVGFTS